MRGALFSVASSHLPALLVNVDHPGAIGKLSLKQSHENHYEGLEGTTAARERTCVARSQCVHVPLVVWCTKEATSHADCRALWRRSTLAQTRAASLVD